MWGYCPGRGRGARHGPDIPARRPPAGAGGLRPGRRSAQYTRSSECSCGINCLDCPALSRAQAASSQLVHFHCMVPIRAGLSEGHRGAVADGGAEGSTRAGTPPVRDDNSLCNYSANKRTVHITILPIYWLLALNIPVLLELQLLSRVSSISQLSFLLADHLVC